MEAVRIRWTEHERGYGSRPDGVTLHKDEAEAKSFVERYWAKMPDKVGGRAPDEYSAPGTPERVPVAAADYERVQREGSFWQKVSGW